MVLTYDAYTQTLDTQEEKESDLAELKNQVNRLTAMIGNLIMEKGAKIEQPSETDVETYSTISRI
jgi:hypothetical protein